MSKANAIAGGLQEHSVGDSYPLAVVGIGYGERVIYVVQNLVDGTTAGFLFGLRQWRTAAEARTWMCHFLGAGTGFTDRAVVWHAGRVVYGDYVLRIEKKSEVGFLSGVVMQKAEPVIPLTPRQEYEAALEQDIG
jgi:hypothetical protein